MASSNFTGQTNDIVDNSLCTNQYNSIVDDQLYATPRHSDGKQFQNMLTTSIGGGCYSRSLAIEQNAQRIWMDMRPIIAQAISSSTDEATRTLRDQMDLQTSTMDDMLKEIADLKSKVNEMSISKKSLMDKAKEQEVCQCFHTIHSHR